MLTCLGCILVTFRADQMKQWRVFAIARLQKFSRTPTLGNSIDQMARLSVRIGQSCRFNSCRKLDLWCYMRTSSHWIAWDVSVSPIHWQWAQNDNAVVQLVHWTFTVSRFWHFKAWYQTVLKTTTCLKITIGSFGPLSFAEVRLLFKEVDFMLLGMCKFACQLWLVNIQSKHTLATQ